MIKKIRSTLSTWVAWLCFCTSAYGCTIAREFQEAPYPPLQASGGKIIFSYSPIDNSNDKCPNESDIAVDYLDNLSGAITRVDNLPYLTESGRIEDVFIEPTKSGEQLFIIHRVPIRAYSGVAYASDYFSVLVYTMTANKFEIDRRLTIYFGSGADILEENTDIDIDKIIYTYPYKSKNSILHERHKKIYQDWVENRTIKLKVSKKSNLYTNAAPAFETRKYLVAGDSVLVKEISADWVSIVYTAKNQLTEGWLPCSALEGCR